MIKINVITNNKNWLNYIKKPNYYLDKKRLMLTNTDNLCVNDIKFTIYRHYKRPKHMHHYNHSKNYN